ncbi:hypothetical protein KI688_000011 [Linnemannia hyalina]|uniref:Uncharacterized protein n=1 Tax=Linnemannia hyalina TaxID=64524 RepID=A0A9P7Y3U0_9FUNG|nr:hypothetical protein KI688_000011 [Linnemannia hyalina]
MQKTSLLTQTRKHDLSISGNLQQETTELEIGVETGLDVSVGIINAQNVQLPAASPDMPDLQELLFDHAVDMLKRYQQQKDKEKDATLVKDAQVAMSRVLNTMSPRAVQHFTRKKEDQPYSEVLHEHDVTYLARKVLLDRAGLVAQYPLDELLPKKVIMQDKVFRIVEYLCHIVCSPPYKTTDPSENDCLLIWAQVFGIIADKVSILSGERMLESSKLLRRQQAAEFGDLCDTGRKVDLAFAFKDIEISNIEFKRPNLPTQSIIIQSRKNIRLGRCIQEIHKGYGVQDPSVIMGDVSGSVGMFHQLARMDEIWIAGKMVKSTVQIPTTPGSLESFLESNSLALIWNYTEYLERQGPRTKQAKEHHDRDSEMGAFSEAVSCSRPTTPPRKVKPFSDVVTFSPSKKRGM